MPIADLEYCRAASDKNEFAARLRGLTRQAREASSTNEDTTTSPASTSVPNVSSPLESQLRPVVLAKSIKRPWCHDVADGNKFFESNAN